MPSRHAGLGRAEWFIRSGKFVVWIICLIPLSLLMWGAANDGLGANPVEALIHGTGETTLRLLLATLAVTPLRQLTGWAWLVRYRRVLGLFAFFYATLHLLAYAGLDQSLEVSAILQDVLKRPYITVGFAAFVLLVPLAVTSTRGWIRRLGQRWKRLHRAVYLIAILGVLHYLWLVKADLRGPLIYGGILAVLLASRLPWRSWMGRSRGERATASAG